jgi:hypothetical protein
MFSVGKRGSGDVGPLNQTGAEYTMKNKPTFRWLNQSPDGVNFEPIK